MPLTQNIVTLSEETTSFTFYFLYNFVDIGLLIET